MGEQKKDHSRHYEIGREWATSYLLQNGATSVSTLGYNFLRGNNGYGIHLYARRHHNAKKPNESARLDPGIIAKDKEKHHCNIVEIALVRTFEKGGVFDNGSGYIVVISDNQVEIPFTPEMMESSSCHYIPLDVNKFMYWTEEENALFEEIEKGTDGLSETERSQIIRARVGQSVFKRNLLVRSQTCEYCGLTHLKMLTGSHIKDWIKCDTKYERLDKNNGLLLCPNHDKLLDLKLMSFDEQGNTMLSDKLSANDILFLKVDPRTKLHFTAEQQVYLAWHRKACGFDT